MRLLAIIAALGALVVAGQPARAAVLITVDKSTQQLTVSVDGATRYRWPVSTARWGYNTPNGVYRPQRLERQWYSRKYDWSPMPHSIFFAGGYAIHGSYEISRLGRPASHGCIRLHPKNAATLFELVRHNTGATRIEVTGSRPEAMVSTRVKKYREAPPVEVVERGRVQLEHRVSRRRVDSRALRQDSNFEEIFSQRPRYRANRAQRDEF
ncbi:L,D-transpeptidase [Pseudolabrys sp. Root1462]|uniref:L,D-transpeptidase family protein n=1 Tax=Pseudolabrys sp. Root1462 TaxID=1736466 RepID=UPI000ABB999E